MSSPRRGRPTDRSAEETRATAITVARRLFAELGYGGTSLRTVADEIGITAPSLYHHFPSKDDLFTAVATDTYDRALQRIAPLEAVSPLPAFLSGVIDAWGSMFDEDPTLGGFLGYAETVAARSPELDPMLQASRDRVVGVLTAGLERGVAAGDLAPGTDPGAVAGLMRLLVLGMTFHASLSPSAQSTRAALKALVCGTLFAPARGGTPGPASD